jgi:hypothetical protein
LYTCIYYKNGKKSFRGLPCCSVKKRSYPAFGKEKDMMKHWYGK